MRDTEVWHAAVHGVAKSFRNDWVTEQNLQLLPFYYLLSPYFCSYLSLCSSFSVFSCGLRWRRQWQATPVLLPGKSHGRRSLVDCSPWRHEELDTTERFHFHFSLSCVGEGNCNPLQCSCLENPRDGGAWWAAIYGVAQSGA